ncbi:MAG: hypothetical protein SCK28_12435 [Bacillota bacterium]|nr:hypothetical protein [Bacillota bacterium]
MERIMGETTRIKARRLMDIIAVFIFITYLAGMVVVESNTKELGQENVVVGQLALEANELAVAELPCHQEGSTISFIYEEGKGIQVDQLRPNIMLERQVSFVASRGALGPTRPGFTTVTEVTENQQVDMTAEAIASYETAGKEIELAPREPVVAINEQEAAPVDQPITSSPATSSVETTEPEGSPAVVKEAPAETVAVEPAPAAKPAVSSKAKGSLNSYVLDVIKTYPIGSSGYPYLLNNDYANYNGVTTTLSYQNKVLLKAHPSGNRASHCSGITFEVFFKAMQHRNKELGIAADDFNGMSWNQLNDFVMIWFVANGGKQNSNIEVAVEKYGIGHRVNKWEDAQPGDFMDFSRENNTGHTVVFINWIREGDKIVGLKYWSSQQSTNGINYKEEYFNITGPNGKKYGNVRADNLYIARVAPVSEYKSLR